jgi:hypothetical protein
MSSQEATELYDIQQISGKYENTVSRLQEKEANDYSVMPPSISIFAMFPERNSVTPAPLAHLMLISILMANLTF